MNNRNGTLQNIGVVDHDVDLFEGQYRVPDGMRYNSYLVLDDEVTIFDTVDNRFADRWLQNIKAALGQSAPAYLVVQHMEPDHSGSLAKFIKAYPSTTIVGNTKTFAMIKQFFNLDETLKKLVVADGDTLCTGAHTFLFVFAPMVHWPEVMVTYDEASKVLFSADAFGSFGAFEGEEALPVDVWAEEASRYFIGIVGKYGMQVQTLLKKAAALDIQTICALHGPTLTQNIGEYVALYDTWSAYRAEKEGVVVAYSSIYGHTKEAVSLLCEELKRRDVDVVCYDLARCDQSKAIADAFRYDKLVLASSTYNAGVLPFMHTFIHGLLERNFQNKTVGLMENGSWAITANKTMRGLLEKCKQLTFTTQSVTVKSALQEDSKEMVVALAEELSR